MSLNMPTQQSVGHNSHAASINDFNVQLKAQPWYQDFIRQAGFEGRPVQLSHGQRDQLQQLILAKGGVPHDAFNDMKIDPAGNLNTEHGFASQPTWLKALEIGGAATAGAFAAPGSIGSLFGVGGAPTATGSVATATGAGSSIPTIAGTTFGTGMAASPVAIPTSIAAGGVTGNAAAGGGSIISRLLGHGGGSNSTDNLADTGSMFESFANDEAKNRIARGDMSQGYDRNMIAAQQDQRANETDAMRKLNQTGYITSGGSQFKPSTISLGGQDRQVPTFGLGPSPITDAQKQGASTLQEQLLNRLKPGGSYTPQPLSGYANPGVGEKIGKYGSLISSGLGMAKNVFGF